MAVGDQRKGIFEEPLRLLKRGDIWKGWELCVGHEPFHFEQEFSGTALIGPRTCNRV